jgi:hypothetical protein
MILIKPWTQDRTKCTEQEHKSQMKRSRNEKKPRNSEAGTHKRQKHEAGTKPDQIASRNNSSSQSKEQKWKIV